MIDFQNGSLQYISQYIPRRKADMIFNDLLHNIPWKQKKIFIFGKWIDQPRKIYWNGDIAYCYSSLTLSPSGWDPIIQSIRDQIQKDFSLDFNHALLNLYENENHYISWHSDDEKALGKNPPLALISFGMEREIWFRRKDNHQKQCAFRLEHGSLLLMLGSLQHYWQHSIPKKKSMKNQFYPRISITFRYIYQF